MGKESVHFDPFDRSFVADPYPHYRSLREQPAACWSEALQGWLITRFDDVLKVLREHERFSSDDRRAKQPQVRRESNPPGRNLVSSDPPVHTRLRKIISRGFTPKTILAWEPRIRELVREILNDRLRSGRPFDVISDLAAPLPLMVIAELLGVATAHWRQFWKWSEDEITAITPDMPQQESERLKRSSRELHDYFHEAVAQARTRTERSASLLGLLVSAADKENTITEDELVAFAVLLLRAGNATTTNLIGNGVLALARNPEQTELLRAHPEISETAVDEFLRYDGPVQSVYRIASERTSMHGITVDVGDRVFAVLASANRDERKFDDPDTLRLDRQPNDHVAFGAGIHSCMGARLARLETRLALEGLVMRLPRLTLAVGDDELDFASSWSVRALSRLPIEPLPAPQNPV